jgi:hypothetical protein
MKSYKPGVCYPTQEGFQIRNGSRFYNRPLYGQDHISMVLAGDRPAAMMNLAVHGGKMGNLHIGLVAGGNAKWFHEFGEVVATYIPGLMKYEISDRLFPKVKIILQVVPLSECQGFAVKISGKGLPKGARIVWMYGGASGYGQMVNAVWQESYFKFAPQDCVDNDIEIRDGYFWFEGRDVRELRREDHIKDLKPGKKQLFGATSLAGEYKICEATGAEFGPNRLFEDFGVYNIHSTNIPSVVVFGSKPLPAAMEGFIFISFSNQITELLKQPEKVFADSVNRVRTIANKIAVRTPDMRLDRVVESMNISCDALWYDPCFSHGTRMWLTPYLGWEIYFGPEVSGRHDRVKTAILAFCKKQLPNGAISSHYTCLGDGYNMNEQFLDQIIYHYLWTGDKELMREIMPVLDRVLQWQKENNDPDRDDLYTNTLNTWESDYHWYYGGACTQSSAYTWWAYRMLGQIADEIGLDGRAYLAEGERIKTATFDALWLKSKGIFAEYKDTFGLKRLHEETEQASIYIPAQVGLTDDFQTYQMLRWVETHLEPIIPHGPGKPGKLYWGSNWRPTPPNGYQHTSRDPALSISLNTLLGYYRIGESQKGYEMLLGAASSCYINRCPGAISYKAIGNGFQGGPAETTNLAVRPEGVDLANTVSLFLRDVVEGLFGIRPQMQHNHIVVEPHYPPDWNNASIKTDDIELDYQGSAKKDRLAVTTPTMTTKTVRIIAKSPEIKAVRLNGQKADYDLIPAIGHVVVEIKTPALKEAVVQIDYGNKKFISIKFNTVGWFDKGYEVKTGSARLIKVFDPQEILSDVSLRPHGVKGKLAGKNGFHTFFVLIEDQGTTYWNPINLEIKGEPVAARPVFDARLPRKPNFATRCEPLSLAEYYNLKIEDIFKQQYVSPKPARRDWIRPDGLSGWNAVITPDDSQMREKIKNGKLLTEAGIPFRQAKEGNNAVFVSQWDNFPACVQIPVGKSAGKIYFLISGTTFPMQSHLANGRITVVYCDGGQEQLDLINPDNYDDGLADFGYYHYAKDNGCEILGKNTHADIVEIPADPARTIDQIVFEALSNQVVIGLLGMTLMK